jgi:hypothetical protein
MIPLLERQTLDNRQDRLQDIALHRTYDPGHFYSLLCVKLPLGLASHCRHSPSTLVLLFSSYFILGLRRATPLAFRVRPVRITARLVFNRFDLSA